MFFVTHNKMMLPNTTLALIQESPSAPLKTTTISLPPLQKGQVLVKMEYASINPSDLSLLKGTYVGSQNYPLVPGIEGSGTVIASGGGILARLRMGKRVACTSTHGLPGCWAEYMVTQASNCIPLPSQIDFKQGAAVVVNPLTAVAFMELVQQNKAKVVLNNAAGGALGMMVHRLSQMQGITLISIVRSEKQKPKLMEAGALHVLNSADENYHASLKDMFEMLKPQICFDAVGGDETSRYLELGPRGMTLFSYAFLSQPTAEINLRELLQNQKTIRPFYLGHFMGEQSLMTKIKMLNKVKRLLATQLKTHFVGEAHFDTINEALLQYSNQMSEGKWVVRCGV